MARASIIAAIAALAAAVSVSAAADDSSAQAVVFQYLDDEGVGVTTVTGSGQVAVWRGLATFFHATVDHIAAPEPTAAPVDAVTEASEIDTPPMDAVTTASGFVGADAGGETRFEGAIGLRYTLPDHSRPVSVSGSAGTSRERDHWAAFVILAGDAELLARNVAIHTFVGAGLDVTDPTAELAVSMALPETSARRVFGGLSVSQLLSPRALIAVGASITSQWGVLASPYRGVAIGSVIVPEVVPGRRDRVTGFVQLAVHLGARSALHVRQGGYVDTWGVRAIIPEAALARRLGDRWLATVGYRYYSQSAADFYQPSYTRAHEHVSADRRLGALYAHTGWARLSFAWSRLDDQVVFAGYQASQLSRVQLDTSSVSHVVMAGVRSTF